MHRRLLLAALVILLAPGVACANAFDHYTNELLAKIPEAEGTLKLTELTPGLLVDHNRVLPNLKGAFIVVKTNEGRWCKLLVHAAGQKVKDRTLPLLLIERFVTYKEGEERTVLAEGNNLHLYQEFQLNLDLGQIVPASVGGDIRLIVTEDKTFVEPIGKAEIYLVTKPLAAATPKKADKVIVGATFEPKYWTGSYALHDDGRRTGKLVLKANPGGTIESWHYVMAGGVYAGLLPKMTVGGFVEGWYYSDKDGAKYEVTGKIGKQSHGITFKIHWPRTVEEFQGWMFTGDGRAICGTSRIQDREAGFFALRIEE